MSGPHPDPVESRAQHPAQIRKDDDDQTREESLRTSGGRPPRKWKRCGVPIILSDTEEHFTFTLARRSSDGDEPDPDGLTDNEAIRFEKEGNESWIETVKWAKRNRKGVCVRYDERDAEAMWIDDEVFLVYPPTDLFEQP